MTTAVAVASRGSDGAEKPSAERRGRRVALLAAAWSVPALCGVGMQILVNARTGNSETIWQLLGGSALPWYVWAPATPLVKRIARRFPLRRVEDVANVAVHACASIAMTVLFVITMRAARRAMGLPVADESLLQVGVGWSPFTMLAYAAVAAIAHAELYATRADLEAVQRAVLAEQLARAQLNALRMQLHPHFLFNALNTIAMLVRDQDSATAVRLIAELGVIMRELLRDPGAIEVPLAEELDVIRRYLGIEQIRFGGRLVVQWDVDERLLDAAVPPLILQPLVENAIRHGIAHCTTAGSIRVGASARGQLLVLTVRDTGPFGPPQQPRPHHERMTRAGVGLANTRARLTQMYGDRAFLRLERLERSSTWATVGIPLTRVGPHADSPECEEPGIAPWFAAEPSWDERWASR